MFRRLLHPQLPRQLLDDSRELRDERFDADFYLETYPDVRSSSFEALAHYEAFGRRERRYANASQLERDVRAIHASTLFDSSYYASQFQDLSSTDDEAIRHYLTMGVMRNARPNSSFDPHFYLAHYPPARESIRPPFVHYLECLATGATPYPNAASDPANAEALQSFDARYYTLKYPDIGRANLDPFSHFLTSGRDEGRLGSFSPDDFIHSGAAGLDEGKPTVLVCCHQASLTGAPITGLHLAEHLQRSSNVVVWLGESGPLVTEFEQLCVGYVVGYPDVADSIFIAERLRDRMGVTFAILNSVVTWPCLLPIRQSNVPIVLLIHEFTEYTFPKGAVSKLFALSNRTIFPAELVRESSLSECDELLSGQRPQSDSIRNQGLNVSENRGARTEDLGVDEIRALLGVGEGSARPLIVLGCGWVQLRKGVDLFVETARALMRDGDVEARFVWVGDGFSPEAELNFSTWLRDQIRRSEIEEHLFFFEQQRTLEAFLEVADVFFLPSRLDPFPNVVIEALFAGKPILCFAGTTGFAEYIRHHDLCGEVVPYLDTRAAAGKLREIARDPERYRARGVANASFARRELGFADYARYVHQKGIEASDDQQLEGRQCEDLRRTSLFDVDFFLSGCPNLSPDLDPHWPRAGTDLLRTYVTLARRKVHLAKSRPGFNDRLYYFRDQETDDTTPPLLHAWRHDRPLLTHRLLRPSKPASQPAGPMSTSSRRVAVHVHAYHKHLAPDLIEILAACDVSCDVFVTTDSEEGAKRLRSAVREREMGRTQVLRVPARTDDIGAMMIYLREVFLEYEMLCHLHDEVGSPPSQECRSRFHQHLASAGTETLVADLFEDDPLLGLLFLEHARIVGWANDRVVAEDVLARMDSAASIPAQPEFPVGRTFWTRPASLIPLSDLHLDWATSWKERSHAASPSHPIAGLLPTICEMSGHIWATLLLAPGSEQIRAQAR